MRNHSELTYMTRDELDRATLAAQDPDAVSGLHTDSVRRWPAEPAADWRTRHGYASDVYENDEGAPLPDAYTADEKRARDRARVWVVRFMAVLLVGAAMWLAFLLPIMAGSRGP